MMILCWYRNSIFVQKYLLIFFFSFYIGFSNFTLRRNVFMGTRMTREKRRIYVKRRNYGKAGGVFWKMC